MKVIFLSKDDIVTPFNSENRIELYPDTSWESSKHPWNDYGFETTFASQLFFDSQIYKLPFIKILIEGELSTHDFFKNIINTTDRPYIEFPLIDKKYISLATDVEFYKTLFSLLSKETKETNESVLSDLHDASYIKHTSYLQDNEFLFETEGFKKSLLRDMTSKNALKNGWLIIENRVLEKDISFELFFQLENYKNSHDIEINFKKSIFPNNINILIGSNGTGKSQALIHLIDELLDIGETPQLEDVPQFNQIVVIAYSPYENFRHTLEGVDVRVKSVYQYFGFKNSDGNLNLDKPFMDSIDNILKIIHEDNEKDYIDGRPNKFDTFLEVIGKAIDFDFIGLEINEVESDVQPTSNNKIIDSKYYVIKDKDDFSQELHVYEGHFIKEKGLIFIKNDKVLNLSSGQQIFAQLISSIIVSIREDTILLIDEPELYLHPNLEVELIELLKELLEIYKSYAIIATHSAIVAREVPKNYITVLKRKEENILIARPPFETFGGDIERINSYVFFDKDIDKPFERWLQKLVNEAGGAEEAVEKYGDKLNEESIILMYGMKVEDA